LDYIKFVVGIILPSEIFTKITVQFNPEWGVQFRRNKQYS